MKDGVNEIERGRGGILVGDERVTLKKGETKNEFVDCHYFKGVIHSFHRILFLLEEVLVF